MNSSFAPLRGHSPNPNSGFTNASANANASRSTFTFRLDDENAPPDPTMAADAIIPGEIACSFQSRRVAAAEPQKCTFLHAFFREHLQLAAEQRARGSLFPLKSKSHTSAGSSRRPPRPLPRPAPRRPSQPRAVPSSQCPPPSLASCGAARSSSVSTLLWCPRLTPRTTSCTSFGQPGYLSPTTGLSIYPHLLCTRAAIYSTSLASNVTPFHFVTFFFLCLRLQRSQCICIDSNGCQFSYTTSCCSLPHSLCLYGPVHGLDKRRLSNTGKNTLFRTLEPPPGPMSLLWYRMMSIYPQIRVALNDRNWGLTKYEINQS